MKTHELRGFGLAVVAVAVIGVLVCAEPAPGKSNVGVGVGVSWGNSGCGTNSWLGIGYSHRGGHDSWGVGVGVGSGYYGSYWPGYSYSSCRPYYGYYPTYGYYPNYGSAYYSHGNRHHSNWAVSYSYSGGYPYGSPYGYYGSYYTPEAYYSPYSSAPVTLAGSYGYQGDHSSVAVGLAVPLQVIGPRAHRPYFSDRIASGRQVENNPILKRVWVPGHYEYPSKNSGDSTSTSSAQKVSADSSERVWIPGTWAYIPDTE